MPANNSKYFPANARPGSAAVRTFLSLSKTPWSENGTTSDNWNFGWYCLSYSSPGLTLAKVTKATSLLNRRKQSILYFKKNIFFLKVLFGTKQRRNMNVGNIFVP